MTGKNIKEKGKNITEKIKNCSEERVAICADSGTRYGEAIFLQAGKQMFQGLCLYLQRHCCHYNIYGVMKKKEIYTDEQRTYILKKFVQTFLPKVPKYHRNMANELHHVSTTTTRLMKRLFGLHTDFAEMSAIFQSLGYAFFTREGVYNPKTQRVTVLRRDSLFAKGTEIEEPDVNFLYVNVNAQTVRMLRLCTIPTPPNTSEEKVDDLDCLKQMVDKFQKRMIAETQTPLFLDVEEE